MSKFLSLLFGAAILCGGCRSGSDQSGRAGDPSAQPTDEDCTHFGCFWLLSPNHPAWVALDNGVNPPAGQDTAFYSSGLSYRDVLVRPPDGDVYFRAGYHFIATQLNRINGADATDIESAYEEARGIYEHDTPADVAASPVLRQRLDELGSLLMAYNTGELGPGTCTCPFDDDEVTPRRAPTTVSPPAIEPGAAAGSDPPPPPPIDAPPPPPPDVDAGGPPPPPDVDAAVPPPDIDAGAHDVDASVPDVDASVPDVDASVPDVDAGPSPACVCRDRPDHV